MKISPRAHLTLAFFFIGVLFVLAATAAYKKFDSELTSLQQTNHRQLSRSVEQTLARYFDKIKFVVENLELNEAFQPEKNTETDRQRFATISSSDLKRTLASHGIKKVLQAPRSGLPKVVTPPGRLFLWQVFKGLPENEANGSLIARDRRTVVRNALQAFKGIHYIFEMDVNGDLVFLEPFETQKNITSFNFSFRDYLQLAKTSRITAISEGYISHDRERTQIITVATPVRDASTKIVKVLAASVSAATIRDEVFSSLKNRMGIDDGTVFYLVDRHAHVVASSTGVNAYRPLDDKGNDEGDRGNFRQLPIFDKIKWHPDVLEEGNVWERTTKSWTAVSLETDYFEAYEDVHGEKVFGSFYPTPILGSQPPRWGILIETPARVVAAAERRLALIFAIVGSVLIFVLTTLGIYLWKSFDSVWRLLDKKGKELASVSERVAHDIRSPLAALDLITRSTHELPEKKRILIRNAVSRIGDIANDLLRGAEAQQFRQSASRKLEEEIQPRVCLMSSLVSAIIAEKRFQYRSRGEALIMDHLQSYGLFSKVVPGDFKTVLSNLVDNSVEASGGSGVVDVVLARKASSVVIVVEDRGKGMPPEVLSRLGEKGVTHGKSDGRGLGVYHSKRILESWSGTLKYKSQQGEGTRATVTLPLATPPEWFVPKLLVNRASPVVVVDDDPSIHHVWEQRFAGVDANHPAVNLSHYTNPKEFLEALLPSVPTATYLIDYEFTGSELTGIDLIKKLGIASMTKLITSHDEEFDVTQACARLGIGLIPKSLAPIIPIEIREIADD